jgi:phosphatidate cytidylyltransferase
MVFQVADLVLLGLFACLSLVALLRKRIGLPEPVAIYLPYLWVFTLVFVLSEVVSVQVWVWILAVLSFLALREYFSLVNVRIEDRWGILAAYLAIPFMYYYIQTDWYGMFIISVPVYAFLVTPFVVALGGGKSQGTVFSVGVIDLGLFLLVYCIGHVGYLTYYSTWMAVFLVGSVAICDLFFFLLRLQTRSGLRSVALQVLVPWPVLVLVGLVLQPWTGIPIGHTVALGVLIPTLVAVGAFTIDHLEEDLGIDRGRLAPGRGEVLNSLKSLLYTAPVVFHYLRYFMEAF